MKISYREKLMLSLLAIVALLALSYYAVFEPQLIKLEELRRRNNDLLAKQSIIDAQIASIPKLDSALEELEKSLEGKTARFYPAILQDRIITIVDRIINEAQLNSPLNSFSIKEVKRIEKPVRSQPDEFAAKKLIDEYMASKDIKAGETGTGFREAGNGMDNEDAQNNRNQPVELEGISVTIGIKGSYEQVTGLIREIEALNRSIVISGLSLDKEEGNLLSGSIQLDFYALPKITAQDDDYLDWPYSNMYGRTNPFAG